MEGKLKTMRGKYERQPNEVVTEKHRKIIELKEQGQPLAKIARQLNTTYGSVLYVVYRKGGLWQNN